MRGSESGPVSVVVRAAGRADAEALARCQLDCWADAYADLADPERLGPYLADVEGGIGRWRRILASPAQVWLAAEDETVVGFATVRRAGGDVPAHLAAIYVRRPWWGTRLGQRLLDETLGDGPATLRVFRDNARARRFYARNGFVLDGTEQDEPHFGGVEVGMSRPAPAPGPSA